MVERSANDGGGVELLGVAPMSQIDDEAAHGLLATIVLGGGNESSECDACR